jgi:hypothetical protein
MIQKLQNHSNQFDLGSGLWYSQQQWLAMVPTSQKKKILAPINFPGQRPPHEWEQSAVTRKAKSTARLQRSTSASLTVSVPLIATHMEPVSSLANVQSLMHDSLLPMLERVQQPNGRSPRQSPLLPRPHSHPRFPRPRFPRPRFPRPHSLPRRSPPCVTPLARATRVSFPIHIQSLLSSLLALPSPSVSALFPLSGIPLFDLLPPHVA